MYNRNKTLRVRQQVKEQQPKVPIQGTKEPFIRKGGDGNGVNQKNSGK